jgi:hypothetical protein
MPGGWASQVEVGNETTVGVMAHPAKTNGKGIMEAGFGTGDVPGCTSQKTINQGSVQRCAL